MRKVALFFAVTIALSASAAQPNDSLNGQYYRLFTPLTCYHNVAGHALSYEETSLVDEEVDKLWESGQWDNEKNEAVLKEHLRTPYKDAK